MKKESPTESQQAQILEYLRQGYSITPKVADKKFNCLRLSARVFNLKNKGHEIITDMIDDKKSGKRYASYRLAGVEPAKEKVMPGKSISDFSKALRQPIPSPITVEKLF